MTLPFYIEKSDSRIVFTIIFAVFAIFIMGLVFENVALALIDAWFFFLRYFLYGNFLLSHVLFLSFIGVLIYVFISET